MSFRRILVANRGEIACRIFRTVRALGIGTAAIYSEADAEAPHVAMADRARLIGPPEARQSYLDMDKVLDAAVAMDCDAIHPGYGFLSENARFVEACLARGLTFLGPSPDAMRQMGDKARARQFAAAHGTSPVPGFDGSEDPDALRRAAERIGFPLLIKAKMGGGGKGMRLVAKASEFDAALGAASREAVAAFGDGSVLLERYVRPARHVEVQILGDLHGNASALLERECSLQRRHQKVIEESPSAVVDKALRVKLAEAAIRVVRAAGYAGAGTLEFLLEDDGRFWFLEMNTRLQVEHGITELVTGEDLVAWQIRIAAGERLTLPPLVEPRGHAIEARVYAEDPEMGHLPKAGRLHRLVLPSGPGIRVDAGVSEGQAISPFYDPMIAKVMAHGPSRDLARRRLVAALKETAVIGPASNVAYLVHLLEDESFVSAKTYTHTLESAPPFKSPAEVPDDVLRLAAAGLLSGNGALRPENRPVEEESPFVSLSGFRLRRGEGAV